MRDVMESPSAPITQPWSTTANCMVAGYIFVVSMHTERTPATPFVLWMCPHIYQSQFETLWGRYVRVFTAAVILIFHFQYTRLLDFNCGKQDLFICMRDGKYSCSIGNNIYHQLKTGARLDVLSRSAGVVCIYWTDWPSPAYKLCTAYATRVGPEVPARYAQT